MKYEINKNTCWDCLQRIGEECGITGKEVYDDTEICVCFEPKYPQPEDYED
jgi:hypothetical protein